MERPGPYIFVLLWLLVAPGAAGASDRDASTRIRAIDSDVARLLTFAERASPTFARLVQAVQRSDLIVHIVRDPAGSRVLAAATRFIAQAGGARYVRITLYGWWRPAVTIALLGHELQHAVEVAQAEWVVDQHTCAELYESIGHHSCGGSPTCFDTHAAVRAGQRVAAELQQRGD